MPPGPRPIDQLTAADLQRNPVWEFASDDGEDGEDETRVRPVARTPVKSLEGRLVATRLTLANGQRPWAIVGNISVDDPRRTKHFVTVSILRDGRRFHLARYFDVDHATRGPRALARFMGLRVRDVFPIAYDVSAHVRGPAPAAAGRILAVPDERLSMKELMRLSLR